MGIKGGNGSETEREPRVMIYLVRNQPDSFFAELARGKESFAPFVKGERVENLVEVLALQIEHEIPGVIVIEGEDRWAVIELSWE